jgi:hypothetical protein
MTMTKRVRRAVPLTLAIFLAVSGTAFGGDNAGAIISLDKGEVSGVAASGQFDLTVSASGMVAVRDVAVTVMLEPVASFNTTVAGTIEESGIVFTPTENFNALAALNPVGIAVDLNDASLSSFTGGGANFTTTTTGDADLGTFSISMADDYDGSEATVTVTFVRLGQSGTTFDDFLTDALGLSVNVNPTLPAPSITAIDPAEGSIAGSTGITITGANFQDGATVTVGGSDAAAAFVDAGTLTATTPAGAEGAADVVVTNPDANSVTSAGGFTYLPVINPTLSAGSDTDASLDFSPVGSGDAADGSEGEVTFSVNFTDATGGPAGGQDITWAITNNGSESVYLVSPAVLEVAAGTTENATTTTGDDGSASGTFDAEGDKSAGSTSVSIVASTTADNSDGESLDLSVAFSATWDVPVAAELASVTGEYTLDRTVFLQWAVASQTNNLGWEVYRRIDQIRFEQIGDLVPGEGTLDGYRTYSFLDVEPPEADAAYYYLKQLDLDGKSSRSSLIEVVLSVDAIRLPTVNALWQNYPNPFNPETIIGFDLVEESQVSLRIYDVTGQIVATLADGNPLRAGHHEVVWNGLNRTGSKVASGVYFYQIHTHSFTSVKRMTLLQ